METALLLLSIAGAAAVALRVLASVIRAFRGGLEAWVARDIADTRRHRGDITGSQDALTSRAAAHRRRMFALGIALMWVLLLVVPPLTPWPRLLYASYSLLWLLPRRTAPTQAT